MPGDQQNKTLFGRKMPGEDVWEQLYGYDFHQLLSVCYETMNAQQIACLFYKFGLHRLAILLCQA